MSSGRTRRARCSGSVWPRGRPARHSDGWTIRSCPRSPRVGCSRCSTSSGSRSLTARLDAALTLDPADSADAVRLFYVGSYAASRARWQVLRGVLERLQSRAQRLRATGDSSEAGFTEAVRQALEGYAWWRRGQRDNALRLLERSQRAGRRRLAAGDRQYRLRWWLGRLLLEMGRPREALPYFESLTRTSLPADYERGRIYEQLGEVERAREAYALFLAPRQQADPMFQPMIQDARAALQRLAVATSE